MDKRPLEQLSERVSALLGDTPARDIEKNLRALLGSWFDRLQLVTREEFDIQKRLLEQASTRVAELEARIAQIESRRRGGA
jgi:hypothetical protein